MYPAGSASLPRTMVPIRMSVSGSRVLCISLIRIVSGRKLDYPVLGPPGRFGHLENSTGAVLRTDAIAALPDLCARVRIAHRGDADTSYITVAAHHYHLL